MLVMRRRAGESFLVGEDIEIQVLQVSGTRVKLGIIAPAAISIVRREIQITQDENKTAARSVNPLTITALLESLPHPLPVTNTNGVKILTNLVT